MGAVGARGVFALRPRLRVYNWLSSVVRAADGLGTVLKRLLS